MTFYKQSTSPPTHANLTKLQNLSNILESTNQNFQRNGRKWHHSEFLGSSISSVWFRKRAARAANNSHVWAAPIWGLFCHVALSQTLSVVNIARLQKLALENFWKNSIVCGVVAYCATELSILKDNLKNGNELNNVDDLNSEYNLQYKDDLKNEDGL